MSVDLIAQIERYGERLELVLQTLETERTVATIASDQEETANISVAPGRRAWVVAVVAFAVTVAAIGGVALLTGGEDPTSLETAGEPGSVVIYGTGEGIADGCAQVFAVGGDGLWAAGQCGLFRFAGAQWALEAVLPDDVGVYGLVAAPDAGVWVETTSGGVVHYDGETITQYDVVAPFVAVTADGTVWAWAMDLDPPLQVLRLEGDTWVRVVEAGAVSEVAIGGDGAVWVTGDEDVQATEIDLSHYVLRRYDGTWETYPVPEDVKSLVVADVDGSREGLKPTLNGVALGIAATFDGTAWTRIESPPIPSLDDLGIEAIPPPDEPDAPVIDSWEWTDEVIAPNGNLWVTSGFYGALRYDGTAWRHYSTADGLASDRLTFVAIGRDGSVWLGSEDAGLSRILPDT